MAELEESGDVVKGRGKKRRGVRAKKMSTRIDMTPMVDLGFLLVTFFILTTSMQKPKAMPLVMPEKPSGDLTIWPSSESMTIILGANHQVFYYNGIITESQMQEISFSALREVVMSKNQEVLQLQKQSDWAQVGVHILIKPMDNSKYEDLVNVLDEMNISHVKYYAIEDVQPDELKLIQSKT